MAEQLQGTSEAMGESRSEKWDLFHERAAEALTADKHITSFLKENRDTPDIAAMIQGREDSMYQAKLALLDAWGVKLGETSATRPQTEISPLGARIAEAIKNKDPEEAVAVAAEPVIIQVPEKQDAPIQPETVKEQTVEQVLQTREQSPALPEVAQTAFRESYQATERQEKRAGELRAEIRTLAERGAGAPEAVATELNQRMTELEQIERGAGGDAARPKTWGETFRKTVGNLGWWGERAKGIVTMGYWEVHQAERFRSETGKVAKELTEEAGRVEKTEHLNLEAALDEADWMRTVLREHWVSDQRPTAAQYEQVSESITKGKHAQNERLQERLVGEVEEELHRRLEKYRDEYGETGTAILSDPERINRLREHIRAELKTLEDGRVEGDVAQFRRIIRGSIDPTYWHRYIYGGAEAVVGAYSVQVALPRVLTWWGTPPAPTPTGMPGPTSGSPAPSTELNMKDTVWHTVKQWMHGNGVAHPTDSQVMELSKEVVKENGIGVNEWGISGSPMDTAMQQGYLLKFNKARLAYNAAVAAGKIAGHLIP